MGLGSGIVCSIRLNSVLKPEDKLLYQDAGLVQEVLRTSKVIAMVGLSADPQKPSYFVASYLRSAGYTIVPVNPRVPEILGQKSYARLEDIPFAVDVVDVFRPANEVDSIVTSAIAIGAKALWQQLRICNLAAAAKARAAGLIAIVDLCVKMEHGRYGGGLHEAGMNTELVSARRVHRWV